MLIMPAAIQFLYRSGSSLIVICLLRKSGSFRMSVTVVGVWLRIRHGRNFCQADKNAGMVGSMHWRGKVRARDSFPTLMFETRKKYAVKFFQ